MAPSPPAASLVYHPLLCLQAGGFCMAFDMGSHTFPFSTNITPQSMQENIQPSAAQSYLGRSTPWGCSTGGRAAAEEPSSAPAPLASSFGFLYHPTTFTPSPAISSHRFSQTDAAWAGRECLPQGTACRSLDFIFIYYCSLLLFIYSFLFLFHFEHAQLVILVLLKM